MSIARFSSVTGKQHLHDGEPGKPQSQPFPAEENSHDDFLPLQQSYNLLNKTPSLKHIKNITHLFPSKILYLMLRYVPDKTPCSTF